MIEWFIEGTGTVAPHMDKFHICISAPWLNINPLSNLSALLSGNYLKAVIGLISFISHLSGIAVLCCLMSVLCKLLFHVFCQFFVVSGRRINLVPFTPSWMETESITFCKEKIYSQFQTTGPGTKFWNINCCLSIGCMISSCIQN